LTPLAPLRFFAAVSPPARVLVAVLAILAGGAVVLEAVDAGASDWVLASIAIVQLFASATGFHRHATRGYYDPGLLDGARTRLALAHFVVSAAPGLAAWGITGTAEAIAARSLSVPALRASGWAALLLVSAVPWASSLRTSRFAVGVLWLLLTASLLVSGVLLGPLAAIHSDASWAALHPLRAIGVGLGFPMVIPSLRWPAPVLCGFVGISFLGLAVGVAQVVRGEFPLSEEGEGS
jgi:hypothetical protein